ncbi:MAG: hypothetical protein BM557_05645 [Flavobacterium sp. MedPE-SWcel]|uniref:hypothetical protein n=1 Tax=uncultured Flavobacterium sp. TaxID=165435 RepID=UPI00090FF441|nr:hypothetical protein [uncultured Flavobacterium sp.]OIQ20152.1 MAG: hypothetical protein BM557_05645 [Flavobacterium sp. MedPE-SWcel]
MKLQKKHAKTELSMDDLIDYPQDSLGFHVGNHLFNNSFEPDPTPEKEDIYRMLITERISDKEDIAMYYYLLGNGYITSQAIFIIATGALLYPLSIKYFYSKYCDGKNALRFHDLDYFKMLHLPINRIKDTFLIK